MKRIVLTGGGTAGHVTPHLALIPVLLRDGWEVHYVGTQGIERDMMGKQPGVAYHEIPGGKLRRYFSWQNFIDPVRVLLGFFRAFGHLGRIRPQVVFSKGGFVAVPVVAAAWLRRIPVLAHESDLTPGLANRISARFAKKVAATFPECAKALGKKGVHTGTPMRGELFRGSRERGLQLAGFGGSKPVLLMMGGSQGAQAVNDALRAALPALLPEFDVLHLCGKGKLEPSLAGTPGYFQAEFLDEALPDALAAADLVLSRAGANAIGEFLALRKPMLLVPYPKGASRGDQILNAENYRARGLAMVLPQEEMTADSLAGAVFDLRNQADTIRAAMAREPDANGSEAVYALIRQLAK
ncbi:MAG TPA: undecaprenyldiphospho-muramoylpentapeptide beta-N-acetylglucosaminyltransferase [Candidatus Limnocylindria bacterium]|nr:undecaprenyldiphospho-muramoylpentapeptide beta-N-acetylglucosaminyltransferase [Candidatus Limnocylindria bacterium]